MIAATLASLKAWCVGNRPRKAYFYHVVLSIGRLMLSIGTVCTAIALIRLRHQRIRFART